MTTRLAIGESAPNFTLPDADGTLVRLADLKDRRVIVYFYPAALTPGCTTQAVDFTAAGAELRDAGFEVIGISPDGSEQLRKFRDKEALSVCLLGDPALDTIKAYGAHGTRTLYGKQVEGVIRSTFVVDVDAEGHGTISLAQYNVRATGHVDKLRRELGV